MEHEEIKVGARYAVKRPNGIINVEVEHITSYVGFVTNKEKHSYQCKNINTGKRVLVLNPGDFTTMLSNRTP